MAQATEIAIISGARTPMGRYCGKLRDFTAMERAAVASREAITLLHELRRRKAKYGLATAWIGGGQVIAMIVENLPR